MSKFVPPSKVDFPLLTPQRLSAIQRAVVSTKIAFSDYINTQPETTQYMPRKYKSYQKRAFFLACLTRCFDGLENVKYQDIRGERYFVFDNRYVLFVKKVDNPTNELLLPLFMYLPIHELYKRLLIPISPGEEIKRNDKTTINGLYPIHLVYQINKAGEQVFYLINSRGDEVAIAEIFEAPVVEEIITPIPMEIQKPKITLKKGLENKAKENKG